MTERLMGTETEYALVARDRHGQRLATNLAADHVLNAARTHWVHLPDLNSTGLFLVSGGRFYIDCGHHPELTTPECANPWDVVRYLKAGERLLLGLRPPLIQKGLGEVSFFRQNVDYSGTGATWGSHESYLHRTDPARFQKHLVPHLVSRLIYTGSGGFDSRHPGLRFVLSPRVPHLEVEISGDSTHVRGILHTKDESLSAAGYHRLHLLCSESLFSERALFLRYGVTALVVALIEAGLQPGAGVPLPQPLHAMRSFAGDPSGRVAVLDAQGRPVTALAIQRHYLALAEAHQRAPFMPPWAEEVCRAWRALLDQIEAGGPDLATSLDWAIRRAVFSRFLESQGYDWAAVARWNAVVENMDALLARPEFPAELEICADLWEEEATLEELLPQLRPRLSQHGVTLGALTRFRALRQQLFELDTRFGQLGDGGLFTQLDQAGVLHHHFPGVDNFEHALACPPAIGRARLRGECVRRFGGTHRARPTHTCDWVSIWDHAQNRCLDLANPFAVEEVWKTVASPLELGAEARLFARRAQMQEIMASLARAGSDRRGQI